MLEFSAVLDFIQANTWLWLTIVAVVSLVVGSFLNVVIHRLPLMMEREYQQETVAYFNLPPDTGLSTELNALPARYNIAVPASRCPSCQHQLGLLDNIPLLSWALLKGQCRYCQAPISARYPAVELLTAILSATVAWYFGTSYFALLAIVVTWALVALTFIDLDKMLLPDQITLPLLWLILLASVAGVGETPADALLGAAAGYLSLWSVYWLFKLLTGKEGMGYGDFKLMAVFGALLGASMLPFIILCSSVVGAVFGIFMLKRQQQGLANPIPFGPYIAIAGWIAMLWGESITQWYLAKLAL